MFIKIVGTGSSGNTYIVGDEKSQLIVDLGMPMKDTMRMLDYSVTGIQGCIVSHAHTDHIKYKSQYLSYGLDVWEAFREEKDVSTRKVGDFTVQAFRVPHDGEECRGFVIRFGGECVIYLTDMEYCPYQFIKLKPTVLMVECNYSDIGENNAENKKLHVLKGHASVSTCRDIIKANNNPRLKQIILIHPSRDNLDTEQAMNEIRKITKKNCMIAEKGAACLIQQKTSRNSGKNSR